MAYVDFADYCYIGVFIQHKAHKRRKSATEKHQHTAVISVKSHLLILLNYGTSGVSCKQQDYACKPLQRYGFFTIFFGLEA